MRFFLFAFFILFIPSVAFGALEYTWPLELNTETIKPSLLFTGQIDPGKFDATTFKDRDVKITLSVGNKGVILKDGEDPFDTQLVKPEDLLEKNIISRTSPASDAPLGINKENGAYFFTVDGKKLVPGEVYYYAQRVVVDGGQPEVRVQSFTSRGHETKEQIAAFSEKHSYRLLSPLPGLSELFDPELCKRRLAEGMPPNRFCNPEDLGGLNGFLNYAFMLIIGIAAVVLVFRLMYEGYIYMTTDVPFLKASSKSHFFQALLGLLLALSAYIILNTINPQLVSNDIAIQKMTVELENVSMIDPLIYKKLTGQEIKAPAYYSKLVDTIAAQQQIDSCVVKATIAIESAWQPNIIGCDENVLSDGVPSRTAFVKSGIKLDGVEFSPVANKSGVKNICPKTIDISKPGYGLDWRFSKGGGLMQVTKYPEGYDTATWYEGVKKGKTYWNQRNTPFKGFEAIITPEENIKTGIDILKNALKKCNNSVESAFRLYQGGLSHSCNYSTPLINTKVAQKMQQYNLCKSNSSSYGSGNSSTPVTYGETKSILAIGDSITVASDSYVDGFVKKNKGWVLEKAAIGGRETKWMVEAINTKASAGKKYDVVTILGGTNDTCNDRSVVSVTNPNFDKIITVAKKIGRKVVVVSPPTMKFAWGLPKNICLKQEESSEVDLRAINSYLASYPGVVYIDLYTKTTIDSSLFRSDKIHLNSKGHQWLRDVFSEKIK